MLAEVLPEQIFSYLLVFARVGTVMMLLPGIGEAYVFARVRLALALAVTLVILPLVQAGLPALPTQVGDLFMLVGGEILQGLMIGMVSRMMISALHVAGTVIAFQSSLAYAQMVDPNQGTQGALISSFLTIMGVLMVFVTGLHAVLLAGIRDSYSLFPVGALPAAGDLAEVTVHLLSASFAVGIKMSAPFIVYGLIFYIGLGILQRLMPQLQLFFVIMPVQLLLAFVMLMLTTATGLMVFLAHFEDLASQFLVR